jgi:hypothetical protein
MPANRRQAAAQRACWAHELKHGGYRLQIHVRDGRVRLFTMNGADWSKRYPLIVRELRCLDRVRLSTDFTESIRANRSDSLPRQCTYLARSLGCN